MAMMRAAAANQGYLKYASGYPLTLTKTLSKPPESFTVSGNTGGVGDKTVNLFDKRELEYIQYEQSQKTYYSSPTSITSGYIPFDINSTYTWWYEFNDNPRSNLNYIVGYDENFNFVSRGPSAPGVGYYQFTNSNITIGEPSKIKYIRICRSYTTAAAARVAANGKIILVKGAYSEAQMKSRYKPCGYEIPIIISDGTTNKTINLYSDSALGVDESLTVNPKAHEATKHDDTSVAGLQNWEQDFTLPKTDSLTVTAGTTVVPGSMQLAYWSSRKN